MDILRICSPDDSHFQCLQDIPDYLLFTQVENNAYEEAEEDAITEHRKYFVKPERGTAMRRCYRGSDKLPTTGHMARWSPEQNTGEGARDYHITRFQR